MSQTIISSVVYTTYLKKNVDNENVKDILERVDNTVEHSLEFGHALDRLQGPEDAQHAQRLDCAQVLAGGAPAAKKTTIIVAVANKKTFYNKKDCAVIDKT